MLFPEDNHTKAWLAVGASSILFVLGVYLWFVPPGTIPFPPGSIYSDAAISHWPSAFFLRESVWKYGQWPLWNPEHMLGQPFAANPLNKVWYPPQWLVLVVPPTVHLDLMIYLHAVWLVCGMIAWAKREGLHPLAAGFTALVWGLNAKLIAHLGAGHLDIFYSLAWVPWLLWAIRRMTQFAGVRPATALGTILAMVVLADLRIAFYMIPFSVLYALSLLYRQGFEWRTTLWKCAGAIVSGSMLTAVVWLPLVSLAPLITRSHLTIADAAEQSLPLPCLIGTATGGICAGHEFTTYLSVPVLLLAALSLRRKKKGLMQVLWAASAVAGLWALGDHGPLFQWVVRMFPAFGWFRIPSRAWFVTALGLSLLSGFGLDSLLRNTLSAKGRMISLTLAFAGAIWIPGTYLVQPELDNANKASLVLMGAMIFASGVGIWVVGGGLSRIRLMGRRASLACVGLLIAVTVFSFLFVDRSLIEGRSPNTVDGIQMRWIERIQSSCGIVYSPSFDLIGPSAARAHLRTLHGVDPMQFAWSAEAISEAAGVPSAGYSITAPPIPSGTDGEVALALAGSHPDTDLLAALGVTTVAAQFPLLENALAPDSVIEGLYHLKGGGADYVSMDEANQRLKPAPGDDNLLCDGPPNRMIRVFEGDLLPEEEVIVVFPQAWAPGWRAWVDGKSARTIRVGGVLLGAVTSGGSVSRVEVAYRPVADIVGILISIVTVIAMIVVWVFAGRSNRYAD